MIVEQLIFTFISFALFVYMFFRMIKNNDTTYIFVLVLEAIGIAFNFGEVLFSIKSNIISTIIKYVLGVILPITIITIEKKGSHLYQIVGIAKTKIYKLFGANKKAKQELLNLLEKDSENYQAHKMLAEVYEQEGGMRKAIDEYVQAIDLNKKDYNSYYTVAKLLNDLERRDEAAQMLSSLLDKKPEMYEASILLGEILLTNESYKEAVKVYQDALRYQPVSYDLNYNLGIAYTMLNDFQNAKICYDKAADINSLAYNSKYSLAEIALIYKDLEEAKKKFMETIEEEELSADAYFELSKIYLLEGDKDNAIKYINTAIDINSKKIVIKIKRDPIFIPIMAKISMPFNLEDTSEDRKNNLTETEIKAKEHLEEMAEITRNIGYNDIQFLNKKEEKIKKEQKEIDANQKEIQE
ncbi:MAG: tetratricopeptide repeat protein [Clostridia bacterium]|nr:tetratricopeptide repeat protein [Clostridia bacterium]